MKNIYLFPKKSLDFALGFVGIVALLRLVIDMVQGNEFSELSILFVILLASVFLVFSWPWIRKSSLKRHFAKRPDKDKTFHFEIDKHKIVSKTEGLAEGNSQWSALTQVVRTPQGFLFYPNDRLFYWLPNHAFALPEDTNMLADMARQYAPKYVDLT